MPRRPFLSLMLLLFAAGVVNAAVGVLSPSTVGDDVPTCSACGPLGCEVRLPADHSAVDQP
jgi:hypothetical protein